MMLEVSRRHAVAYRLHAHGLHRELNIPAELGVLDLGVQDTRGSAQLAIGARLADPPQVDTIFPDDGGPLTQLWSFRGAPHIHRTADLDDLTKALWPRSDTDAFARLGAERKALTTSGVGGLQAFTAAAKAMRKVVTKPMAKGAVSAGVTKELPACYSYACRGCGSTHVFGGIFQLVGLPAGVEHIPDSAPLTITPRPGRAPIPANPEGTDTVVRAYLTLHGPATVAEVAGYLGTTQAETKPSWPADLAEVSVEGRRTWLPKERLDALENPPEPPFVRLLPSLDPYLQAKDRELIVPSEPARKALWRILGNPGVVLVNGEVAGTWRARTGSKKRLDVTVQTLETIPPKARKAVTEEAERMATTRGIPEVRVGYE
jgi:hypothetical protein